MTLPSETWALVTRKLNQRADDQAAWHQWVDGDADDFTPATFTTGVAWEHHQYDWRGLYGTPGR